MTLEERIAVPPGPLDHPNEWTLRQARECLVKPDDQLADSLGYCATRLWSFVVRAPGETVRQKFEAVERALVGVLKP